MISFTKNVQDASTLRAETRRDTEIRLTSIASLTRLLHGHGVESGEIIPAQTNIEPVIEGGRQVMMDSPPVENTEFEILP